MVYKAVAPADSAAAEAPAEVVRETMWLTAEGSKHEVAARRMVIGRSKDCDIQLADPNVSRRHAEVRQEGATYWLVDLDSTNGVEVDGKRVNRLRLVDGTRFTIGSTEIVFSQELA
jgi:pSer/pThr/pTyr-binding forkhead associated (FHA) protein